jgi:hypothetical protein
MSSLKNRLLAPQSSSLPGAKAQNIKVLSAFLLPPVHLIPPFTTWGNFSPRLLGVHLVRSRGSRAAAGVYVVFFALLNEGQIAVSLMAAGIGSGK